MHLFDRSPYLNLNADEIQVSSKKRFKVLTTRGLLPLTRSQERLPHFSAMCTVSAHGSQFRLTFILPDATRLPEDLRCLQNEAYFISTANGWMTKQAFLISAHFLVDELQEYRRNLPLAIADQRCLLVLDGHSSRFTVEASAFLNEEGVDVLILPSHCTHVLQAFDVCIASPLKTRLAHLCEKADLTLTEEDALRLSESLSNLHFLAEKRQRLVRALLLA
jgi:hypothetical protein